MTHHITAYCRGDADRGYYDLTDWRGNTILEASDSRITVAREYYIPGWGRTYAIVYRLPNNRGWIVGYSLGHGCLFRGEYFPNPHRIHTRMDTSDAERYSRAVAEYWIERDQEDLEQFELQTDEEGN